MRCLSAPFCAAGAWLHLLKSQTMAEIAGAVINKTIELEEELKRTGLWQKETPPWVHGYDDNRSITNTDFAQWLQFVFIPNHLHKNKMIQVTDKKFIVPHAIKYFGDDLSKGSLLQILIEIDSLL